MATKLWMVGLTLLSACSLYTSGGDDDDATDSRVDVPVPIIDAPPLDSMNPGFTRPVAVTKANQYTNGIWTEIGDADWTCLGTPSADQPSTGTIALTGRVEDFQTGNGVGSATITAWSTSPSLPVGTALSSNDAATRGQFSMTLAMLPSGTRRYGFTLEAPSYVTTRLLGRYYPPGNSASDDLMMLSEATALALPAFVGVERDVTKAMYIGTMLDCQGRPVSNAAAAISSTPSAYQDAGGITFYFSAGSTSLPVRHTIEPWMNNDGLFTVLGVPPSSSLYVQVWGFRSTAELDAGTLTLLGEIRAPANANESVSTTLQPRRI